jgi:hypothetical protein
MSERTLADEDMFSNRCRLRESIMCPMCMTTAAIVAASTTTGAGVFGFIALKWRRLRRMRQALNAESLSRNRKV